jgi:phenylalanyl-tRNA synthetase beta chain
VAAAEGALWVKGAVEAVAAAVRAAAPVFVACDHPACTPGWGAEIRLRDEAVGWLGLVRPELRHAWRVTSPLALAEVRLAPLLADFGRVARPSPAPPYPAVRRDLACLAPRSLSHAELAAAIRAAAPAELTAVTLFDIFESKEMGAERRSLAYALDFRSPQRTLTDDEVNAAVANIVRALQTQHGVEVRER